jgi:predicted nucleic acid-binding protein
MALYNLADPDAPLPSQLAFDTSFLLALRPLDDNPRTDAAQSFARRVRRGIKAIELVAWLMMPVLQECYHIILTSNLRRLWQSMDSATRPANWLTLYKQTPDSLEKGFAEIEQFDTLLAAFPITLAQPDDLLRNQTAHPLDERLRYFIRRYHLLPQDAMILTEAERIGVEAIATLDKDWRRIAEFDIYTSPL